MLQEEVDALLKGVTDEVDQVADETQTSGVRPYNIATQERIVRGRMAGLEIINDRFARLLRVGIFNFMRRSAEISVGSMKVQKYSEFTRNLPIPTNLNLVHVKPLRGTSLFVLDPNFVLFRGRQSVRRRRPVPHTRGRPRVQAHYRQVAESGVRGITRLRGRA